MKKSSEWDTPLDLKNDLVFCKEYFGRKNPSNHNWNKLTLFDICEGYIEFTYRNADYFLNYLSNENLFVYEDFDREVGLTVLMTDKLTADLFLCCPEIPQQLVNDFIDGWKDTPALPSDEYTITFYNKSDNVRDEGKYIILFWGVDNLGRRSIDKDYSISESEIRELFKRLTDLNVDFWNSES